jgi:hypothetical protein
MFIKLVLLLLLDSFFGVAAFDLEGFLVFLTFFEGDSCFVSAIGAISSFVCQYSGQNISNNICIFDLCII